MICSCDYDMPTIHRDSIHRARKSYHCEECHRTIQPGERYERTFGVWSGDVMTYVTCEQCHDAREWTRANIPCVCWAHGNALNDCVMAVCDAEYRATDEAKGVMFGLFRHFVAIKRAGGHPPRNVRDCEFN